MGWRIVEIESDEYIQLYLNNLLIKRPNEKIMINISDIDTLILNNDRATISLKLINALTAENVNVIVMNSVHEPGSYIMPVSGNHMSLKILEKQINWNHEFKGKLWQEIIKNKIYNQAKLIERMNLERCDEVLYLINEVKHYDISNREGHAAKVYWHALFGVNFTRDQDCFKNTVINSMLNYGYAIIRSLVIRSIYKKGLDPRISLFHKSFTNFFALASDLMEPFRQLVDEVVFKHRDKVIFSIEVKEELLSLFETQLTFNGKKYYINQIVDQVVDGIVKDKGWQWVDLWD